MDVLTVWKGKEVFEKLAEIYGQLYLEPGEEGEELYPEVVLKGRMPEVKKLDHFHMTDEDSCCLAQTPAGGVMVITLHDRRDFETFLQIMGKKCRRVDIPATQGASILDGVINHRKIEAHRDEFFRKAGEAGKEPDQLEWMQERSRFLEDKKNYRDALIILSVGPYSGVPADKAGYAEQDWLSISQTIRMYHECTHFVCRRLFPDKIDAIWDELAADAVGIYAALGRYDLGLAGTVLGIRDGKYTGGRLENYVPEDEPDQKQFIDRILPGVLSAMEEIGSLSEKQEMEPFELAVRLEKEKEVLWKPEQASPYRKERVKPCRKCPSDRCTALWDGKRKCLSRRVRGELSADLEKEMETMSQYLVKTKKRPSQDAWLTEAWADPSAEKIGMYLTHCGVVRGSAKALVRYGEAGTKPVAGMYFSYDEEKVERVIEETLALPGIYYLRVWLNSGVLVLGDPIMQVMVGGDIRPHVIEGLQFLVGKIKIECVVEEETYKE